MQAWLAGMLAESIGYAAIIVVISVVGGAFESDGTLGSLQQRLFFAVACVMAVAEVARLLWRTKSMRTVQDDQREQRLAASGGGSGTSAPQRRRIDTRDSA